MISCYLLHSGLKTEAPDALDYYGDMRTHDRRVRNSFNILLMAIIGIFLFPYFAHCSARSTEIVIPMQIKIAIVYYHYVI